MHSKAPSAFHQPREPSPLFVLDTSNLTAAARLLAGEVRHKHALWSRKFERGDLRHFLFIDPSLRVFLLADRHACADAWTREHWEWFVGAYVPYQPIANDTRQRRRPALVIVAEGLEQDMRDHLAQLLPVRG